MQRIRKTEGDLHADPVGLRIIARGGEGSIVSGFGADFDAIAESIICVGQIIDYKSTTNRSKGRPKGGQEGRFSGLGPQGQRLSIKIRR